jgi:hypothetical protein
MSWKIRLPEMTEKRKGQHIERKLSRPEHLKDSLNTEVDNVKRDLKEKCSRI